MSPGSLGRQQARCTVGIPLARDETLRQIIVAGEHGALSVGRVDDLSLVKHIVKVFHIHAMLAVLGGYTSLWEEGNPFVRQATFGVLDLQVWMVDGGIFDEGIERILAIVGVQRSRPARADQHLGFKKQ